MIEIDGSAGEGGGQVLRTTLSLAAWRQQPVRIRAIRARHRPPGLKPQHRAAIAAVAALCHARTAGDRPGSTALDFHPDGLRGGIFELTVGTAGATALVAQAALPPLWAHGLAAELVIRGGTHVAWSPPFDYLRDVFAPMVRRLGLPLELGIEDYGFYPRGGGRMTAVVAGGAASIAPAALEWQRPARQRIRIEATAVVGRLPRHIAERMLTTARRALRAKHWRLRERILEVAGGPGAYLFLRVFPAGGPDADGGVIAGGFTGLGAPGKPAELVAEEAVAEALAFLDGDTALDARLADQILLPALAAGRRVSFKTPRISRHLRTNAATIARFCGPCVTLGAEGRVTIGRVERADGG